MPGFVPGMRGLVSDPGGWEDTKAGGEGTAAGRSHRQHLWAHAWQGGAASAPPTPKLLPLGQRRRAPGDLQHQGTSQLGSGVGSMSPSAPQGEGPGQVGAGLRSAGSPAAVVVWGEGGRGSLGGPPDALPHAPHLPAGSHPSTLACPVSRGATGSLMSDPTENVSWMGHFCPAPTAQPGTGSHPLPFLPGLSDSRVQGHALST